MNIKITAGVVFFLFLIWTLVDRRDYNMCMKGYQEFELRMLSENLHLRYEPKMICGKRTLSYISPWKNELLNPQ
jgi:hypothetical protein